MCQYTEVFLDVNFWQDNQLTLERTKQLEKCKHYKAAPTTASLLD